MKLVPVQRFNGDVFGCCYTTVDFSMDASQNRAYITQHLLYLTRTTCTLFYSSIDFYIERLMGQPHDVTILFLKVHKRENFFGSDIEICTFSK
jgi:hypothetical protein